MQCYRRDGRTMNTLFKALGTRMAVQLLRSAALGYCTARQSDVTFSDSIVRKENIVHFRFRRTYFYSAVK
jgi:hypothetical protein